MTTPEFSINLFLLKVRDGLPLTTDEIQTFIKILPELPDAQVSAFLVHAFHRPLTEANMVDLTLAMRDSGTCLDWHGFDKPVVDKHSTGGVGDKITICLAPLLAALGLAVPTVAGRGLGHTGGTSDKFEAVPGFSCDLSARQMVQQVRALGVAVGKQSDSIAPADRRLYALRDVTGTVPSIPLITASILSKKLAENLDALVIDLKCGSGAFMPTLPQARALAESLVKTASGAGCKTRTVITNMNQPLGVVSGNLCEMREAACVLKNESPQAQIAETRELTLILAAHLYNTYFPKTSVEEARALAEKTLASGEAYAIFKKLLQAQGADPDFFETPAPFIPACAFTHSVHAAQSGFVHSIATRDLGQALVLARAGRQIATDRIDPAVSLHHPKKIGDPVRAGDVLATLHYNDKTHEREILALLESAYRIAETPPEVAPLVYEVL